MLVNDIDYEAFLPKRLSELRAQKNVSAREMSLSLGQHPGYINRIENGNGMPSMPVFFYICQYLDVTPSEFFSSDLKAPHKLSELMENLKSIDAEQIGHLNAFITGFKKD